jgi:hypothetical protein
VSSTEAAECVTARTMSGVRVERDQKQIDAFAAVANKAY